MLSRLGHGFVHAPIAPGRFVKKTREKAWTPVLGKQFSRENIERAHMQDVKIFGKRKSELLERRKSNFSHNIDFLS